MDEINGSHNHPLNANELQLDLQAEIDNLLLPPIGVIDQEPEPEDTLREPDSMAESDLKQDILLCNSKLLHALKHREISGYGNPIKNVFTPSYRRAISCKQIPHKVVAHEEFEEKVFCGIFSADGSLFLSACQGGLLRVYDAQEFRRDTKLNQGLRPRKKISAINYGWGILDVAFSPNGHYLAYSTWSSEIRHASGFDNDTTNSDSLIPINLRPEQTSFAPFSIQFSGNNIEILSGGNDGHVYVCNTTLGERTFRFAAHEKDVNAVRYLDETSHVVVSGGDEGLINVWDLRKLNENDPKADGTFAGHIGGITFIDVKEDACYFLSNSKDQTVKIWDMRKPCGQDAIRSAPLIPDWDYRSQKIPRCLRRNAKTVRGDTSIKTYHGHEVTKTHLRARFSPMYSTGQKYIYCGCAKGNVVVYDIITGDIVSKEQKHKDCVRDVSWHPFYPTLVSCSWDKSFIVWDHATSSYTS